MSDMSDEEFEGLFTEAVPQTAAALKERIERMQATAKTTGIPLFTAVQGPFRFTVPEILSELAAFCPAGVDLEIVLVQLLDHVQSQRARFNTHVTTGRISCNPHGLQKWRNQQLK